MGVKQKDYLSTCEAAELLGVAVSTIQSWANNGLLRAWSTGGGHRRIARNSVDEMLSEKRAAAADIKQDKQLSIVIVEDDPQQIEIYDQQFMDWDMNVNLVIADDGYEGLIKVGRILPDVIITDLKMPRLDGFKMIDALIKMPEISHSLIIVASALTEDEIIARGGLPDRVHYFNKPVSLKGLEVLLRQKSLAQAV